MAPGKPKPASLKKRIAGVIRIVASAIVLAVVLKFVSAGAVLDQMRATSPLLWLAVLAGFVAGHAAAAAKWRWMIGGTIPYRQALKAHFAGLAANLALPGVAGGDLVRAGLVMKGSDRKTALAVGSLADRLIDTASLVVISAIGAIWLGARAGVDIAPLSAAAAATIAAGGVCVAQMRRISRFVRRFAPTGKIGAIIADVADAMDEMTKRRGVLIGCAVLSVAIQFAFACMNASIALQIGVDAPIAAWVFAWPLAKLIATLPISFGGLGVREASLAGLMAPLGYPAAGVVAASLVWQTILYAGGALGALAQLIGANQKKIAAETGHG
jgi:uncharacterized membrane protein YbhN (UPF0104 family)